MYFHELLCTEPREQAGTNTENANSALELSLGCLAAYKDRSAWIISVVISSV